MAALELDARRVRITLDSRGEAGQQKVAWLYRHARVLRHETIGARTVIVADVPRRGLALFPARAVSTVPTDAEEGRA
jgi:hypothetical protein